jgi:hypothetical protein
MLIAIIIIIVMAIVIIIIIVIHSKTILDLEMVQKIIKIIL